MRFTFLFVLFLILAHKVYPDGWRKGEMEIVVYLADRQDAEQLYNLRLNGDIYRDHALLYLTPDELEQVEQLGMDYQVRIKDLNAHYRDFWQLDTVYHTYEEIIALMDSLVTEHPDICQKYIYGSSVGNRELSALKISDSVEHDQFEPEIAFDGGIHGDEIGGAENLIRFARHLCTNYGSDPDITHYIDNREIWIFPMVNPDGRVFMSRYNLNGIDLNRDWGYMWDGWGNSPDAYSQVETRALRDFVLENQFSIHTTFHSGTEVMLYPWYYRENNCPDHDAVSFLSMEYSLQSGYSNLAYFPGFTLYPTNGTTGEGYYGVMGSYGLTMEISYDKQPPESQLMFYYNANVDPMLMLIEKSGYGIRGKVSNAATGDPVQARITIDEQLPVYTDSLLGDYHKFLLPGVYDIRAEANGYQAQVIQNVNILEDTVINIDFQLNPVDSVLFYGYKIISCQIPGNNYGDEGNTPAALGAPDSVNYSIGKSGWVVIDMQKHISDAPGNDIKVYEGDISPEAYGVYGSLSIDGPWQLIGEGYGTQEYDLAGSNLDSILYLRIEDDDGGQSSGNDIGFDLDAVSDLFHPEGIDLVLSAIMVDDSSSNNNGILDPGETVELVVEIINFGSTPATTISGVLQSSSAFINIIQNSSSFGSISPAQASAGAFEVSADASTPLGETVSFDLELVASGGSYSRILTFDIIIGRFPVLIIDLDPNHNSGTVMETILNNIDIPANYTTSMPGDLNSYEIVFLCLGIVGNKHELEITEGIQLEQYLLNGGNLYMEGGDTWYADDPTPVHPLFDINGLNDGFGDLNFMLGVEETFVEGMNYQYDGENISIDRIIPMNQAFVLFYNQVPLYYTCIANETNDYKTIGSVFEFGGLVDGASTREELMWKILEFFDGSFVGLPDEKNLETFQYKVYPNPFQNQASFEIDISEEEHITIDIYDALGRKVIQLANGTYKPGQHAFTWSPASHLRKGIYLYKILTGTHTTSGKLILVK